MKLKRIKLFKTKNAVGHHCKAIGLSFSYSVRTDYEHGLMVSGWKLGIGFWFWAIHIWLSPPADPIIEDAGECDQEAE